MKRKTTKEIVEEVMDACISELKENQINIIGNLKILTEEHRILRTSVLLLLSFVFGALGIITALLVKLTFG